VPIGARHRIARALDLRQRSEQLGRDGLGRILAGVRRHAVVDAECWFNSLYIRAVPSHAIELAAVYLDRSVAAVLA
jgi:hypothetical protein